MPKQTPQLHPKQPAISSPTNVPAEQKKESAAVNVANATQARPLQPKKKKTYISRESRTFAYMR